MGGILPALCGRGLFDSTHYDAGQIYKEMFQENFYTDEPVEVYWEMEEAKLIGVIGGLIGH